MNQDGRPDFVFTNSDGFGPSPKPGPRPWHGVQWLENKGNQAFQFHRIADLGGAYSPVASDFDNDGDIDILAVSAFYGWSNPESESIILYRNDGKMNFSIVNLVEEHLQFLTIDVADFNNDGYNEIASGGFHAYQTSGEVSRLMIWRNIESKMAR